MLERFCSSVSCTTSAIYCTTFSKRKIKWGVYCTRKWMHRTFLRPCRGSCKRQLLFALFSIDLTSKCLRVKDTLFSELNSTFENESLDAPEFEPAGKCSDVLKNLPLVTMCNLSVRKWMSSPGPSRISWAASPLGCDINRLGSCRKWNNFISTFTSLNVFSGFFFICLLESVFFLKAFF